MTFDEFISKYLGQKVDYDGAYGGQCVDLFRQYLKDVTATPQPKAVAGAADFWTNFDSDIALKDNFLKIANTPDGVPLKGDVMFWNKNAGGGFGHVDIFIEGNASQFTGLDQNWPTLSKVTKTIHNYTNVLGWMRPKSIQGGSMQLIELLSKYGQSTIDDIDRKIFEHVGTTWGNPDAEPSGYLGSERRQSRKWTDLVKYLEIPGDPSLTLFEDVQRVIAGIKSRVTDLQSQLSTATAEVGNKDEQIIRLKSQLLTDTNTLQALYDNEKALRTKAEEKEGVLTGQVQALQTQLTTYAQDKGQLVIDKTNAENSAKQWEAKYRELLTNGVAQDITFFDALSVLFKSVVGWAKNTKIKKADPTV